MENDLEKCFQFIIELEKLKGITRKVKPLGQSRYENSAEHSWQVTVLAMTLAKFSDEEINIERVVKMLLVHDIGEIDAGDVIFFDDAGKEEAKEKELKAVKRIFGLLPEETGEEFFDFWKEMEYGDTPEAKFARAVDRVMPILQNIHNNGQSWNENGIVKEQILTKTSYIGDASEIVWDTLAEKIEAAFS
jgi:putative hydrolase of HD superfamily